MKISAIVLAAALTASTNAMAAPKQPPEPGDHPSWRKAADDGIEVISGGLIDPDSAKITWTSGFQWGYAKPFIGPRVFGWVACGTVNAKNRMGGYAGASPFFELVDASGAVTALVDADWISTCDTGKFISVNPELSSAIPTVRTTTSAPVDVADEIGKLASLRDKGVISGAEFDAQKAKLLGR